MTEGAGTPAELSRRYLELLADASGTGRSLYRPELESLRLLGERSAESGHGLREVVSYCLGATREVWQTLPGIAGASTLGELRRAGEAVLAATDAALAALGEGHERAQRLAVRQEEALRREFIDDLLYGRSDPGVLAERAERFGLRLARTHAVAVAAGEEPYDDVHPVVRRVERELVGRFGERDVLLATKDGRLVCVAPDSERAVLDFFAHLALRPGAGYRPARRVATGRRHSGAGGVVRSYEEALGALDFADRLALPAALLKADELLVFPVLMRDRAAMAELVRSVLGPLTAARGGARLLLDTIAIQAEAGYVNAEAARRLGISVRTLSYRLERIKSLTGYDLSDALQRYTLETAAMGARLLGWPEQPL
ncbi:PucR family transcriptional regulator [Kitasatospora purpeofusca]|uniref:PucR family transcriptional regulator n=1 Tax=Kitasatospora purpeofusca TaxID=67352 RepID=UPI002250814A|nr:helix-turn-helix domain-containing protein [Kitasatospora purpeofusca]MCX4758632.1 helix-turn-helix domain-containing protein [Kitasatospora purpeofusca]WSR30932.1 helix-turn-helix domain-containing protein [Kitasatospora purpeofusca]